MVQFSKLISPVSNLYSDYAQNQEYIQPNDINFIINAKGTTLGTLTETIEKLHQQIGVIAHKMANLYWVIGFIGVIIGIALAEIITIAIMI